MCVVYNNSMNKLRTLDLFSGVGGLTLGTREWCDTVCYCEYDARARAVLRARMGSDELDTAPIHDDVNTIGTAEMLTADGKELCDVECIVAGWPCTNVSSQGNKQGLDGAKSGLFYRVIEAARRYNPSLIIMENVFHMLSMKDVWSNVLKSLNDAGYRYIRWITVSAADVGAPHGRKRVFMIAKRTPPDRLHGGVVRGVDDAATPFNAAGWNLHKSGPRKNEPHIPRFIDIDSVESRRNTHRFRALGNLVVPPQARLAVDLLLRSCGTIPTKAKKLREGRLCNNGFSVDGVITAFDRPALPPTIPWPRRIIQPPPVPEGVDPARVLTEPWSRPAFPTPTCNSHLPTKRLNRRRTKDFGSALYFNSVTTDEERKSRRMNPQYLEWAMGLRPDYTRA